MRKRRVLFVAAVFHRYNAYNVIVGAVPPRLLACISSSCVHIARETASSRLHCCLQTRPATAEMSDPRKDFILANIANLCAVSASGKSAIDALTALVSTDDAVNKFLDDARCGLLQYCHAFLLLSHIT